MYPSKLLGGRVPSLGVYALCRTPRTPVKKGDETRRSTRSDQFGVFESIASIFGAVTSNLEMRERLSSVSNPGNAHLPGGRRARGFNPWDLETIDLSLSLPFSQSTLLPRKGPVSRETRPTTTCSSTRGHERTERWPLRSDAALLAYPSSMIGMRRGEGKGSRKRRRDNRERSLRWGGRERECVHARRDVY